MPSTEEIIKEYGSRWDFEECYRSKWLKDFDQTIQKACQMANQQIDKEDEKAWFNILLCLEEFVTKVSKQLKDE